MFTNVSTIVLIIAVITIVCFSAVYITMFSLYYINRKKVIDNNLEDDDIKAKLEEDITLYNRNNKKKKDKVTYKDYYYKHKNSKKIGNIIGNVFLGIIFAVMVAGFIWSSVVKVSNQNLYIGNKTYLVIETASMASVNSNNTYINTEKDKNSYLSTRIEQYSLIGIDKYTSTTQIKQYDIVAFSMDNMTVVHRLVSTKVENGKTLYTFRGDANSYSLSNEIDVSEDRIIGVYNGFQNQFLGQTIIYLQSGVGLITIFAIIIVLSIYMYYYDKIDFVTRKKYEQLLDKRFESSNKHYTNTKLAKLSTQEIIVSKENDLTKEDYLVESSKENESINDNENELVTSIIASPIDLEDSNKFDFMTKSYKAKVCLASDEARNRYNQIKNYVMSYKKVNCRTSKQYESYNLGRNKLFLLVVKNKNVIIYFNLDPSNTEDKYHIQNVSNTKKYESYPSKFIVKSDRGVKFAIELINKQLTSINAIKNDKYEEKDYLVDYPKSTIDQLKSQGEIK